MVAEAAARHPDTVVVADERGRALTAARFAEVAERVAAGLAAGGVGAGQVVAWQLPTSIETAVLMAALGRLDAVQQPLMPSLGEREVSYLTALGSATTVVIDPSWRGVDLLSPGSRLAAELGAQVIVCDHRSAAPDGVALPTADPAGLTPPNGEGSARRWLYATSGTSANPKGVWHSDDSALAACPGWLRASAAGPGDVYPIAFPLAHIGGLLMLAAALTAGYTLVLLDGFDPQTGPRLASAHGATVLGSAAPFLHAYLAAQRAEPRRPLFPRLRVCVSGGAAKAAGLHDEVRATLGGAGVISSWGLTEFPLATFTAIGDDRDTLALTEGRPVDGVELGVRDPAGAPVDAGQPGELVLRGPQCFLGYADPAEQAGAFTEDGFFRTGDLGVQWANGAVQITGRLKDVIVRNAENISASEVEGVLASCPGVAEVSCVGLPDQRTGERLCAVVVPGAGAEVTLDGLTAHCRAAGLARYKWPEQVVVTDRLPRSGLGKVAKADLRARLLAGPAAPGARPS